MNASHLMILLADASFGVGIAVGIGTGIVTEILFGAAGGAAFASKKIGRQLTAAIESEEISVVDKDGKPVTSEPIFGLLNEKFDKV